MLLRATEAAQPKRKQKLAIAQTMRGYRFLPAVERMPNMVDSAERRQTRDRIPPPAIAETLLSGSSKSNKRKLAVIVLSTTAILLAALYWNSLRRRGASSIQSIAVLPFDNYSSDSEQQYFADGMTEALTAELGQIHSLRVPSRTSVMLYKRANKPIPQIARELDVDALVEGSVTRFGDRVGITVQLLDGSRDQHLWGEHYERDSRMYCLYSTS
jgi:TolB-like protein